MLKNFVTFNRWNFLTDEINNQENFNPYSICFSLNHEVCIIFVLLTPSYTLPVKISSIKYDKIVENFHHF